MTGSINNNVPQLSVIQAKSQLEGLEKKQPEVGALGAHAVTPKRGLSKLKDLFVKIFKPAQWQANVAVKDVEDKISRINQNISQISQILKQVPVGGENVFTAQLKSDLQNNFEQLNVLGESLNKNKAKIDPTRFSQLGSEVLNLANKVKAAQTLYNATASSMVDSAIAELQDLFGNGHDVPQNIKKGLMKGFEENIDLCKEFRSILAKLKPIKCEILATGVASEKINQSIEDLGMELLNSFVIHSDPTAAQLWPILAVKIGGKPFDLQLATDIMGTALRDKNPEATILRDEMNKANIDHLSLDEADRALAKQGFYLNTTYNCHTKAMWSHIESTHEVFFDFGVAGGVNKFQESRAKLSLNDFPEAQKEAFTIVQEIIKGGRDEMDAYGKANLESYQQAPKNLQALLKKEVGCAEGQGPSEDQIAAMNDNLKTSDRYKSLFSKTLTFKKDLENAISACLLNFGNDRVITEANRAMSLLSDVVGDNIPQNIKEGLMKRLLEDSSICREFETMMTKFQAIKNANIEFIKAGSSLIAKEGDKDLIGNFVDSWQKKFPTDNTFNQLNPILNARAGIAAPGTSQLATDLMDWIIKGYSDMDPELAKVALLKDTGELGRHFRTSLEHEKGENALFKEGYLYNQSIDCRTKSAWSHASDSGEFTLNYGAAIKADKKAEERISLNLKKFKPDEQIEAFKVIKKLLGIAPGEFANAQVAVNEAISKSDLNLVPNYLKSLIILQSGVAATDLQKCERQLSRLGQIERDPTLLEEDYIKKDLAGSSVDELRSLRTQFTKTLKTNQDVYKDLFTQAAEFGVKLSNTVATCLFKAGIS